MHRPSWFSDERVMVSTAPTCGLTKGGRALPLIDLTSGARVQTTDPETGEPVDAINDRLLDDALALKEGRGSATLRFVPADQVSMRLAVPIYHDHRFSRAFADAMQTDRFRGFRSATLGQLLADEYISISGGHGSPSSDQRVGDVPYIKVSDLRAGLVNINPTNRVPRQVAERFWRGPGSGLQPFDILSPERTSKNIGDFCVLMPGQERVLLTKEIIVMRPGPRAEFDSFFLLWALTLKIVRDQWKRIVFMQTNREDVGGRYLEIEIPVTDDPELAARVAAPFATYYKRLSIARSDFAAYLNESGGHHFFVSGAEEPGPEEAALAAIAGTVDVVSPDAGGAEDLDAE